MFLPPLYCLNNLFGLAAVMPSIAKLILTRLLWLRQFFLDVFYCCFTAQNHCAVVLKKYKYAPASGL
jgi:hypothetical protein